MGEKKEISYEKTQESLEKSKESFVFFKNDIVNPYFSFYFEQKLLEFSRFKTLFTIDKSEHIREQIEAFFKELKNQGFKKENIEKIEIGKNGLVKFYCKKEDINQILVFDINANNPKEFFKGDEQKVYTENMEVNRKMLEIAEKTERVVDAMDYIFEKNDEEWFGKLNNEDILTTDEFGEELKFHNLKYLAKIVQEYFKEFEELEKKYKQKNKVSEKILKTKQRFFDMIMGIGDKYEGAAKYIKKTEEEINRLVIDIVNKSSKRNILEYIKNANKKIDENNYQTTLATESYKEFSKKINKLIFDKFKKENASQKDFLEFAKIISGKNESILPWGEAGADDNLKSSSETMEILNDIILYLMMRKGGIMDKVNKSSISKIEDEKIGDKDTFKIVGNFKNILAKKLFGDFPKKDLLVNGYIKDNLGYGDILNIKEGQKYSDLTYEQKIKISVLYRVTEKINDLGKDKISEEELYDLFNSIAIDATEEIVENMTDIFGEGSIGDWLWGKSSKDLGLTDKTDIEIYEFFKDFQGVGALDFSDRTISNLKDTGKFAAVLAIAMVVPPIALGTGTSALTMGMAMGATASVASMAINPKGYDTIGEAVTDISSDIALGTITGALGGAWAARYEGVEAKAFSKEFYKNQKVIMGLDLMFLGLIPEAGRMWTIDGFYNNKSIYSEGKK